MGKREKTLESFSSPMPRIEKSRLYLKRYLREERTFRTPPPNKEINENTFVSNIQKKKIQKSI